MRIRTRIIAGILVALTLIAVVGAPTLARRRRRPPPISAFLSGFEEVPPVFTAAEGFLRVKIVKSGDTQTVSYRLEYRNIANATAAHLHFGQYGVNGGVIAFLCGGGDKPACPPTGGTVSGTIDAADVVGPVEQGIGPGEIGDLIKGLRFGIVYANIHTNDGDPTPNTGPGDLSTGEIRGQVLSFFAFASAGGRGVAPIPGRPPNASAPR